ncbi:Activator of basal transcription 1 [Halocaridina rubra]|uniref:Activator of basal transcription 1 n=1 Tax=Halocaridina rubra TaxID=373956 RepID=A0AAN8ZY50_HALRR
METMENNSNNSVQTSENSFKIPAEENSIIKLTKEKKRKPGIIYLTTIPTGFDVNKIRKYFSEFGDIDRVYLQPKVDDKAKKSTSKKHRQYTEGWVEFKSKRKAKWVNLMLNANRVGGKRKDPCYDELWNIKYLPRMKWAFLNQRLEYEREVYRQRMGAEISQVRQETDHFLKFSNLSKKKKLENKKKTQKGNELTGQQDNMNPVDEKSGFIFKQKDTESEIQQKKDKKRRDEKFRQRLAEKKKRREEKKNEKLKNKKHDEDFLGSVFVGGSK